MEKRKLTCVIFVILLLLTGCNQTKNSSIEDTNSTNVLKSDMIQQLETDHFVFFTKEQDKQCVEDLANALQNNYTRITNDLHTTLDKKVDIYIYSDLTAYHKAINQPDAPTWLVGNAVPGSNTIQMVNPLHVGRPYSDFMNIIVHEFTHVVTTNMNDNIKSIPIWLTEGIAVFEAKQYSETDSRQLSSKLSDKIPTLKDLQTDSITFENNNGYLCSYSIVDYIVKSYGYDKLIALIKSPSEFENIFGISVDNFQKKWIANLK